MLNFTGNATDILQTAGTSDTMKPASHDLPKAIIKPHENALDLWCDQPQHNIMITQRFWEVLIMEAVTLKVVVLKQDH